MREFFRRKRLLFYALDGEAGRKKQLDGASGCLPGRFGRRPPNEVRVLGGRRV